MRCIDVAIAVICREGQVLICRRRNEGSFAGYWEFPGGRCEEGETPRQALARELREELAIAAAPVADWPPIQHDYPDQRVRLHPILCGPPDAAPQPLACDEIRWVTPQRLSDFTFPAANRSLLPRLIQHLRGY